MAARGSERIAEILEELFVELPGRLRGSRVRLSEQALSALRSLADELNLVTRDDLDELELRVAQLEHRLRLLESVSDLPAPPAQGQ
jgi:polyhydroxyalkanoate synthesis regulator phasin